MATRKTTGKVSPKTSISDLGSDLASVYTERLQARMERAALLPALTVSSTGPVLEPIEPAAITVAGSSPELASIASRYLKADTLGEEDVANVRSLAASVLSQVQPD